LTLVPAFAGDFAVAMAEIMPRHTFNVRE
jgi:hypothetical protein